MMQNIVRDNKRAHTESKSVHLPWSYLNSLQVTENRVKKVNTRAEV